MIALLLLVGCGQKSTHSLTITKDDYDVAGGAWPLTVHGGTLHCTGNGPTTGSVTFTTGGTTYALHGAALDNPANHPIGEITAPGGDLSGLLSNGRNLCK